MTGSGRHREARSAVAIRMIQADTRYSYGEDRYRLMGKIEGRLFVVVYTPRQGAIRVISARKANLREHRHYEDHTRDNRS
jgi:hypothetical protein